MTETIYYQRGFAWEMRPPADPSLVSAVILRVPLTGRKTRTQVPFWVLDYSYVANTYYRLGKRGSRWRRRLEGEAHLHPPATGYWSTSDPESTRVSHSSYIAFSANNVDVLREFAPSPGEFTRFMDPAGKLGRLLRTIAEIGARSGNDGFWRAQALFWRVLEQLSHSETADGIRCIREATSPTEREQFVARVDRRLMHHLGRSISRRELADELNVSVSALAHRYRQTTGISPMQRLLGMRINLAKILIGRGEPLKHIADATGFYDAYHFSRTFKKHVGLSPLDYRNRLWQEQKG